MVVPACNAAHDQQLGRLRRGFRCHGNCQTIGSCGRCLSHAQRSSDGDFPPVDRDPFSGCADSGTGAIPDAEFIPPGEPYAPFSDPCALFCAVNLDPASDVNANAFANTHAPASTYLDAQPTTERSGRPWGGPYRATACGRRPRHARGHYPCW